MLKRFSKYICQSVAAMIGQSVYILADTFLYHLIQERTVWRLLI